MLHHHPITEITWDEAEQKYPLCSAAFDRDMADVQYTEVALVERSGRLVAAMTAARPLPYSSKLKELRYYEYNSLNETWRYVMSVPIT